MRLGAWAGLAAAAEAYCSEREPIIWPSSRTVPFPESKCQMEWFSGHGDGPTAQSISKQLTALQLRQLVVRKVLTFTARSTNSPSSRLLHLFTWTLQLISDKPHPHTVECL